MMLLEYSSNIKFSVPVQRHYFLLRCVPASRAGQTVSDTVIETSPQTELYSHSDTFGNPCLFGSILALHDEFNVKMSAHVEISYSEGIREECSPLFKAETPLTRFENGMEDVINTNLKPFLNNAGCLADGAALPACKALVSAIHDAMEYSPGATSIRTTAAEAFALKKGVCQDYAHIFISTMRRLGLASRYVCGVTKGEGATHAWAEVFIPEKDVWQGFDPTRNKVCDDTYIVFSRGRDFSDCQIDRGVFTGLADQTLTVFVKTSEI